MWSERPLVIAWWHVVLRTLSFTPSYLTLLLVVNSWRCFRLRFFCFIISCTTRHTQQHSLLFGFETARYVYIHKHLQNDTSLSSVIPAISWLYCLRCGPQTTEGVTRNWGWWVMRTLFSWIRSVSVYHNVFVYAIEVRKSKLKFTVW